LTFGQIFVASLTRVLVALIPIATAVPNLVLRADRFCIATWS
jgi:hypothetical protein